MTHKLIVAGGALSVLLALLHALLGWPSIAGQLRDAAVDPDLLAGIAVAWYFGSAAMLALGGVVLAVASRVSSQTWAFRAVLIVGLFYVLFGVGASLDRSPKPQFLTFVAVGALIAGAAIRERRENG